MLIKEESIRQLQNYVNIVDVISDYVQLKKRGKNYSGLCPFHKEKTSSFSVNEEKGLFHCFGCGEGGNSLSFLMKIEKFSFIEAIEWLAKKTNFQLEYISNYENTETKNELDRFYEFSQLISDHFHNNLYKTKDGENALIYLEKRGLTNETIKIFNLGVAPSARGYLINFCEKNKLNKEVFEQLGLFIKSDDGNYYERFRDRIIFPIVSPAGRVIAFGGRILTKDSEQAKYLNSPENKIFIKGKTLFGLNITKDFIRTIGSVILVEGYMDLISLYQKGIKNVVASSGTSLTTDQLSMISRYSKFVFVMYDSDSAGRKASFRASELLLETELDFKIVQLPDGDDPDSFASKNSLDKVNSEIKKSLEFVDFAHEYLFNSIKNKDNSLRINALKKTIELIAKSTDPIKRSVLVKNVADRFNILEPAIQQTLEKFLVQNKKNPDKNNSPKETKEEIQDNNFKQNIPQAEKKLIKLLLDGNVDICDFIFIHLTMDEFENSQIRFIAQKIYQIFLTGNIPTPVEIIDLLEDDELKKLVSEIVFEKYKISNRWSSTSNVHEEPDAIWRFTEDHIKKLKICSFEKEIEKTKLEIKKSSNIETIKKLLEYEKLVRQNIDAIKTKTLKNF